MPPLSPDGTIVDRKSNRKRESKSESQEIEMEPSQLRQLIADLTERTDALRGYL
jgi:hypothetical protein